MIPSSLALAVLVAALGGANAFPAPSAARRHRAMRRLEGDGHGHAHDHGTKEPCGCVAIEPETPFMIDCSNKAAIAAAEKHLLNDCPSYKNMSKTDWEWAGLFPTPENTYFWGAQRTGEPLAFKDDYMDIVVLDANEARRRLDSHAKAELKEFAVTANTIFETATCEAKVNGETLTPSSTKCYRLTLTGDADVVFTFDLTGMNHIAVYTAHVPLEFERDEHFFKDDHGDDIEPEATMTQQSECQSIEVNGIQPCQQSFYIIQTHHDLCDHDTLTKAQELLIHDYEDFCSSCKIDRQYQPGLPICDKVPDETCLDQKNNETHPWHTANLAIAYLEEHCTKNGDKSTCCRTQEEIAAFDVIYAYHEFCGTHIPSAIEDGLHDYEEACEEHVCNTVDKPFDPMFCPETPIPKTWQEEAHAAGWRPCKHNQPKAASKPAEEPHNHRRKMSAVEDDDE